MGGREGEKEKERERQTDREREGEEVEGGITSVKPSNMGVTLDKKKATQLITLN